MLKYFFVSLIAAVAGYLFGKSLFSAGVFWKSIASSVRKTPFRQNLFKFLDFLPAPNSFINLASSKGFNKVFVTSGISFEWTKTRVITLKFWIMVLTIILMVAYLFVFGLTFGNLLMALLGVLIVFLGFDYVFNSKSKSRTLLASKHFGFIMDLLRLQVEGGLNLEQAIVEIGINRKDLWGKEFLMLKERMELGQSLEQALNSFSARFESQEINNFVLAVRQAKTLGVSVAETLKIQSDSLRTRRRQRAEEKARLASVKIALPLVLLIFPALLIIYLVPAFLQFTGN
jgi:tight adherence protein C